MQICSYPHIHGEKLATNVFSFSRKSARMNNHISEKWTFKYPVPGWWFSTFSHSQIQNNKKYKIKSLCEEKKKERER